MSREQNILAGFIILGFVALTIVLFIPAVQNQLPKWTQENMNMVFIAWITQFSTVVNFLFGSSKGSSDKTTAIEKMADKK